MGFPNPNNFNNFLSTILQQKLINPLLNPTNYQVKPGEDLLKISGNTGVDFQQLLAANPNISSVSTGQFIKLPSAVQNIAKNATPTVQPSTGQPNMGRTQRGNNPNQSSPNNYNWMSYTNQNAIPSPTVSDPRLSTASPQAKSDVQAYIDNVRITNVGQQLATAQSPDQLPQNVSAMDIYKLGYTADQMVAAGYTLQNGQYVKGNSVLGSGGNGQQQFDANGNPTTDIYGGQYIQPGTKKWERQNGQLVHVQYLRGGKKRVLANRGLHGRGDEPAPQPAPVIRPDTPSTTLDIILGT